MTSMIIISLSMSSIFMFPLMAQPLSLGLSIMISTLFMCMLTSMFLSSWYGYILFLIYVGGLLVMFAYVSALSPNVLFSGGGAIIFFVILFIVLLSMTYFYPFSDTTVTSYYSLYSQMKSLKIYGSQLVSPQIASILVGLGSILLINLIVVVKICYYQQAPLRPFIK
uniref:NADH-ubiquinone oxidoreductase chain 6 n=1 Tax=Polinices sagamiensis TaxID=1027436 RepID=A0A6G6CDT3_9CAEN|nr:NADH dehydrogenase subunit 6 [Polinices sagamiensis]QID90360.1 NADH dehydrogenase subunit 6 [Polinices sagamiensis]